MAPSIIEHVGMTQAFFSLCLCVSTLKYSPMNEKEHSPYIIKYIVEND